MHQSKNNPHILQEISTNILTKMPDITGSPHWACSEKCKQKKLVTDKSVSTVCNGNIAERENIPVGCVPLACQPYMLWSSDVSTSREGVPKRKVWTGLSDCHQMSLAMGPGLGAGKGSPCLISGGGAGGRCNCHRGTPSSWTECETLWKHCLVTTSLAGSNQVHSMILNELILEKETNSTKMLFVEAVSGERWAV